MVRWPHGNAMSRWPTIGSSRTRSNTSPRAPWPSPAIGGHSISWGRVRFWWGIPRARIGRMFSSPGIKPHGTARERGRGWMRKSSEWGYETFDPCCFAFCRHMEYSSMALTPEKINLCNAKVRKPRINTTQKILLSSYNITTNDYNRLKT